MAFSSLTTLSTVRTSGTACLFALCQTLVIGFLVAPSPPNRMRLESAHDFLIFALLPLASATPFGKQSLKSLFYFQVPPKTLSQFVHKMLKLLCCRC